MRLTVLGCSGVYPTPDSMCSGYLVEAEGNALLLDCGTGVMSRLLERMTPDYLTAIILSHLHPDHILDIYPLWQYLRFVVEMERTLDVFGPKSGLDRLSSILSEHGARVFRESFDYHEVDTGDEFEVDGLTVRFFPVRHSPEALGVRLQGDKDLAYSGDTGPCPSLEKGVKGADIFVCEASGLESVGRAPEGHMTAREAGLVAEAAGVGILLLTHIWPQYDPAFSLAEAQKVFSGEVLVAEDLMVLNI